MSEIRSKPANQAYRDNWPFGKKTPTTRAEAELVCKWWGINEPERMTATIPDEAMNDYLEKCGEENLPETVLLQGYAPMNVGIVLKDPLERILEDLDEEYGDPEAEATQPTAAMEVAEEKFIKGAEMEALAECKAEQEAQQ